MPTKKQGAFQVKKYHPPAAGSSGESFGSRAPILQAAGRHQGIAYGGIPVIATMLDKLGFAESINAALPIFKVRRGYAESDHVLNIALNALSDGRTLDDIELRRTDSVFLKALDARSLPDPTTAGDFCRRFDVGRIFALQEAVNDLRKQVWSKQPKDFFQVARLDADGVFVPTGAECAQGIDWSGHKREWGYHPLVVSLASTQEPLYIVNRSGARPSHEGAAEIFDRAIALCLGAGFESALLRGDTDFSQTKFLDGWDDKGNVKFVFGMDASAKLVGLAESIPMEDWNLLQRDRRVVEDEKARGKAYNFKMDVVREREFRHLELDCEHYAEITYRPVACDRNYRLVIVRKTINVSQGEVALFPETRYFFYISNLVGVDAREIVREANQRCNQENLNAHLKSGVHALRAPLKDLVSNWAYMVMTSLAWSFKAWFALLMPISERNQESDRAVAKKVLAMEFRTFVGRLMRLPVMVIETGRRLVLRLLCETQWTPHLLRTAMHFRE